MSNKSCCLQMLISIVCLAVILFGLCLGGCFSKDEQIEEEADATSEVMPKVARLTQTEIGAMDPEDITQFYFEMRSLSENEVLTVEEMNTIADNFYDIWFMNINLNEEEFSDQSYRIFSDIYVQALEQDIPTEQLISWASLPNVDVICKYLYSNGYGCPENAACPALYLMNLSTDDAARMTKIFFDNPELDNNTAIPKDFILLDYGDEITDQAWGHFSELSKNMTPDTSLSSNVLTANLCNNLLACASDSKSIDKIVAIEKNILDNPYYDISVKYAHFCNAHYDSVVSTAVDSIYRLAEVADKETSELLRGLADALEQEVADKLLRILNGEPVETEETTSPTEAATVEVTEPQETQMRTESAAAEDVYPGVNEAYLAVLKQYWQAATMPEEDFSELYWNQADLESVLRMQEREPGYMSEEEIQHYFGLSRLATVFPYVNGYRLLWDGGYSQNETIPYLYTCYDIDGNGVEELLIGQGDEADGAIIGVFSVKDGTLTVWEQEVGYRAQLTVYLNGTVCMDGSSSASLHSYHFYRVAADGSGFEMIQKFEIDYDDPDVKTVLDAVAEFEAKLTKAENWNWKQIVACS